MKQSAGRRKRLICYRCGGKGHLARLCPSADDCQDVDEVGTEPSSDADSDLFGLDWGDDPATTINSVTERNDRTRTHVESIFLLLPVMAMVICRGKPSGSVFVNTNVASWERLGIAKNSTQFWSIVPTWKRKTS